MAEKQTFKVRVRQYADGSTWSMTHHDLDNCSNTMDDIVVGVDDGTPFREFDIEITSRPPDADEQPLSRVEIPDVSSDAVQAVPA